MKKVLAYFSLLIVTFSLIACSPKTAEQQPDQQFEKIVQVFVENKAKMTEVVARFEATDSVPDAVLLNDALDKMIKKVQAVKVSDETVKEFQSLTVEFLELSKKFANPENDSATKQDLSAKIGVVLGKQDKLVEELEKKYPQILEKYPELGK